MAIAALAAIGWGSAIAAPETNALPMGGRVTSGAATITSTTGSAPVMTIDQSTQRAVVDWNKFDVGQSATVKFNQPNAQSSTLNRVSDANPSQIFGKIQAQGEVILVNQAGVYFSPTSSVDVGSIVASTHNISNDDYMAGKSSYDRNGSSGKVINEGKIKAAIGGYVAMLAPEVRNSGIIIAKMGSVVLASGERITLNFDANKRVSTITTTPSMIAALVENKTVVKAPGGLIILSAQAMNQLAGGVIKQSGTLTASASENATAGLSKQGGRIILDAGNVTIAAGSKTLANGTHAGGSVEVKSTNNIIVESGAKIAANAKISGDGGQIIIMSDKKTVVDGKLSAKGGVQSGNGGLIETSSKEVLQLGNNLTVNAGSRSSSGKSGTWLLDPFDLIINSSAAQIISNVLNSSNVRVEVNNLGCAGFGACASNGSGNLTLASGVIIEKTSGNKTSLTLVATGKIDIFGNILSQAGAPLDVFMEAGSQIYLDTNAQVQANKIEAKAQAIQVKGSLFSYGPDINSSSPLIALLAGRINITGLLRANARNTPNSVAGIITIEGQDEVLIADATIEANGGDGGEIKIISLNGSVNITESYIQTNGGQGRGGAISVAGLQQTIINASTLEATGTNSGGEIALISYSGDINYLNAIIQTNAGSGLGGTVRIDAFNALIINGDISVNSRSAIAGQIVLEAGSILLDNQANLQATGSLGGGNILVGGDWQGGGSVRQATSVIMNQDAIIDASATQNGHGGKVVLWSDIRNIHSVTSAHGSIYAKGGVNDGDGGQVETSGRLLKVDAIKVSTAALGKSGNWLLDPYHIVINADGVNYTNSSGAITSNGTYLTVGSINSSFIARTVIQNALTNGNVTVQSDSGFNITIQGDGTISTSSNRTLTLISGANITFNYDNSTFPGGIDAPSLTVVLQAAGAVTVNAQITAKSVTVSGATFSGTGNISLASSGGLSVTQSGDSTYGGVISGTNASFTKEGLGALILDASNLYTGTTSVNAGTLAITKATGLGSTSGGTTIASGATLDLQNVTVGSEGITINGGTLTTTTGTSSLSGNIALGATNSYFSVTGAQLTLSGVVSGDYGFSKTGSGTLILRGANTFGVYGNEIDISGGTLQVAGSSGFTSYTGSLAIKIGSGATFKHSSSADITLGGNITGAGSIIKDTSSTSTLFLTASGNNLSGGIEIKSGTLEVWRAQASGVISLGDVTGNASVVLRVVNHTTLTNPIYLNSNGIISLNNDAYAITLSGGITGSNNFSVNAVRQGSYLGSITFSNAALNFSGSFINSGTGGDVTVNASLGSNITSVVQKASNSKLILNGANTYTGATTVQAGTLQLGSSGSISNLSGLSLSGSGNLDLNGVTQTFASATGLVNTSITNSNTTTSTLTVSGGTTTFAGLIKDKINLVLEGGALTLSGTNTYTGSTTVNAGTLIITNANGLGATGTGAGTTIASGATLDLQNVVIGAEAITINSGILATSTGTSSLSGAISLGASDSIFSVAGTQLTLSGIVSGSHGYTKDGSGILILSRANTYTGATTINGGVLSVATLANGGSPSGIGQSSSVAANLVINGGTLQFVGTTEQSTDRWFTIGANGATLDASGTGTLSWAGNGSSTANKIVFSSTTISPTLTLTGSGLGVLTTILSNPAATVYKSSLIKSGTGTWTLNGSNTYTGDTNINAGILKMGVSGAFPTDAPPNSYVSLVKVNAGGTLDVNGLIVQKSFTLNGGALTNSNTTTAGGIGWGNSITLLADSKLTAATGATLNIGVTNNGAGKITGAFAITIGDANNRGTVSFQNSTPNDYSGGTIVDYGILQLRAYFAPLSTGFVGTGAVTINSNGRFSNFDYTVSNAITLNGGILSANSPSSAGVFTGVITLTADSIIAGATTHSTSGSVTVSGGIVGDFNVTIGTSDLQGRVTFGGVTSPKVYSYSGNTIIAYGALSLSDVTSLNSSSLVRVDADGALLLPSGNNFSKAFSLNGGVLINTAANTTAVSSAITLMADSRIAVVSGATLILNTTSTLSGNYGVTYGIASTTVYARGTTAANYTGIVRVAGNNSYTGLTTVAYGTLQLGAVGSAGNSPLGTVATGTVVNSGAVLDLNGISLSTSEPLTLNGTGISSGGALRVASSSSAVITYSGLLSLGSSSSIVVSGTNSNGLNLSNLGQITGNGFDLTFSGPGEIKGVIATGAGGLTKTGLNSLVLSGLNTYTGVTRITSGTLSVNSLTDGGVASSIGAAANSASNLVISDNAVLLYTGGTASSDRLFTVAGSGATITANGSSTLTFSNAGDIINSGTSNNTLTLNGSGTATLTPVWGNPSGYVASLTKSNSGTWVLAGLNTYSGITTLSQGELSVNTLANGGLASSIGASTSAASNLVIGTSSINATIAYTGSGVSTDRLFTINTTGIATINASGTGALTFSNPGNLVSSASSSGTLVLTGTGDATLTSILTNPSSGTTAVKKMGAGTWTLSGLNSYTGSTSIEEGVLSISVLSNGGVVSGIGRSSSAAANLVLNGLTATLRYTGAAASTDRLFTVGSNHGTIDSSGSGLLTFANATSGTSGTLAVSGTFGRNLTLTGSGEGSFNPLFDSLISVVKAGTGSWTMSRASSGVYNVTVNEGILKISNATALGNSRTPLVNLGGTLDIAGLSFSRLINLQGGALISSTGSGGELTGGVNLIADSILAAASGATLTVKTLPITGAGKNLTIGNVTNTGTVLFNRIATDTTGYTGTTTVSADATLSLLLKGTLTSANFKSSGFNGPGTLVINGDNNNMSIGGSAYVLNLSASLFNGVGGTRIFNDGFARIIFNNLAGISFNGSVDFTDPINVITSTYIYNSLNSSISTSQGDLILATAGNFTNYGGSSAVSASSGRWIIYSAAPSTNRFDGLLSGNKAYWGSTYITAPPSSIGSGNRYVFSNSPTITTTDAQKIYGDTVDLSGNYSLTGAFQTSASTYGNVYLAVTASDIFSSLTVSSSGADINANTGTYPISATAVANAGYGFAYASSGNGTLTVDRRLITVTGTLTGSITKEYDGTDVATLTSTNYSLSGFSAGEGATVTKTSGTYNNANAGSSKLVTVSLVSSDYLADSGTDLNNYSLPTSISGSIGEITKANAYVMIGSGQSSTYGSTPTINYTYYSAATGTGGSSISAPAGLSGTATITNAPSSTSNAATYSLTYASGLSSTNYEFNPAASAVNYVVNPAILNLTISKAYNGDANFSNANTYSISGTRYNSDAVPTIVSGNAATTSANAATYTSFASSTLALSNTNYTLVGGTVSATINQKALTITANNDSKTYGDVKTYGSGSTAFTSSGLVNSETIGSVTITDTNNGRLATAAAGGTYALTPSLATGGTFNTSNYSITYTAGALTVNKATLTVTADNKARVYGDNNPTLTYSITGYVNSENATSASITGAPTISTTATAASNVNSYTITSAANNLAAANYQFSYADGTLTVNRRPVTVTADNQTRVYGEANPTLTYAVAANGAGTSRGMYNNQTLTGSVATAAVATTNVGDVSITQNSLTNANNANYDITYNNGTLTITPAVLTYNATAATSTYGSTPSVNAGSVTGWKNSETASTATTGTLLFSTTATGTSTVGTYAINGSGLTANNGNYTFTQATGNANALTINQKALTITSDAQSTTYGTALVLGTSAYTSSGLVNSDSITSVTLKQGTRTTVPATQSAGTYSGSTDGILASAAQGTGLSNYSITYAPGTLTINQKALTITANNDSKTYGDVKTYGSGSTAFTSSGLVNSETIGSVTITDTNNGRLATAAAGGTYALTPSLATGGTFNTSNYTITYTPGTLTINKLPITLSGNVTYTGSSVVNGSGLTITNLVSGDTSNISGSLAIASADVGSQSIVNFGGLSLSNSNYTVTGASGSVNVTPAPLGISATGVYTGTTTILPTNYVLTGLVGSDVNATLVSFVVNNKNVASATRVTGMTLGGALASNYEINSSANSTPSTTTTNTVSLTRAPLTITAVNDAKFVTQTDTQGSSSNCNPSPCVGGYAGLLVNGLLAGETITVLSSSPTITRTNASVNSHGEYLGVLMPTGFSSSNYSLSYVAGNYTIVPADTLLVKVAAVTTTYGSSPNYSGKVTAQYLRSGNILVDLTPGISNSDISVDDGAGTTANFTLRGLGVTTSSSGKANVGQYNIEASNTIVNGTNFSNNLVVTGSLKINPLTLTATDLVSGVSKTYDGNDRITNIPLNISGSGVLTNDVIGVTGLGRFSATSNVGSSLAVNIDLSLTGADKGNYALNTSTLTANIGQINQLNSVTYVGQTGGSWSDAANWAGGAIPTLSNVANVVIPSGVSVKYDHVSLGANAPASGVLFENNGVLVINESSNYTLANNISGAGSVTQSGTGLLTMSGNNTFTGGVNITNKSIILGSTNALGTGSVTSSGGTLGVSSGVTLPRLTVNGPVTLSSHITTSGAQIYNNTVSLGGSITLNAGTSSVTFNGNVGHVGITYADYVAQHSLNNIYNLTVLADTININADITTFGTQTYGSSNAPANVVIGNNGVNGTVRTLISEDPAITFWGTINDTTANTHDLMLRSVAYLANQEPTVSIYGDVGAIKPLKTLTVVTGLQETVGSPRFADISQTQYLGDITLAGNITTLGNQEYTANQITVGTSTAEDYTLTSVEGRVIFNTGAGTNVTPTVSAGSTYRIIDTYTSNLSNGASFDGLAALILSEIYRSGVAANDAGGDYRKVGNGGSSMEIVCVNYDDNGNCRFDD